jgi:hypothetical protein
MSYETANDPGTIPAFVTARQIKRAYGAIKNDEALNAAMSVLRSKNWVKPVENRSKGFRPSLGWPVNPKLYEAFPEQAESEKKRRKEIREYMHSLLGKDIDAYL